MAHDGVIACELPQYAVRGPKVNEMVICGSENRPECQVRLDGLDNAVILRSAAGCAKQLPNNLHVSCKKSMSPIYALAGVNDENCPRLTGKDGPILNAWLSEDPPSQPNAIVAMCADEWSLDASKDFVVRRFHTQRCPHGLFASGLDQGLNGWIILRRPSIQNGELLVCVSRRSGAGLDSAANFAYHSATKYSDACGGPEGEFNAYSISFAEGRQPSADVPCLDGPWREQSDSGAWRFEVTVSDPPTLKITRLAGGSQYGFRTGTFSKSGDKWVGTVISAFGASKATLTSSPDCSHDRHGLATQESTFSTLICPSWKLAISKSAITLCRLQGSFHRPGLLLQSARPELTARPQAA